MAVQFLDTGAMPTYQEVQSMIDNNMISENTISQMIRSQTSVLSSQLELEIEERTGADTSLNAAITAEASARAEADSTITQDYTTLNENEAKIRNDADDALKERIEREEGVRETADAELSTRLTALEGYDSKVEALDSKVNELTETEKAYYNDCITCTKLKHLPIATVTVEVKDLSLKVGDVLGTIGVKYAPVTAFTQSIFCEGLDGHDNKLSIVTIKIETNGKVFVLSIDDLTEAKSIGNINTCSMFYLTKE